VTEPIRPDIWFDRYALDLRRPGCRLMIAFVMTIPRGLPLKKMGNAFSEETLKLFGTCNKIRIKQS
jgi:hypothetical protein